MPQILDMPRRWGALPQEWEAVRRSQLAHWLVPIVSNPSLPSVQNSQIPRGKVPSVKTPTGHVKGLTGWTAMIPPSQARLDAWAADPDYGFGVRLGNAGLFALDCDCDDPELSAEILSALAEALDAPWNEIAVRRRGNARWATVLQLDDPTAPFLAAKQIHPLEGGAALEVLVKGQQLAIAGTHPSGARYTWENGEVGDVQHISLQAISGFLGAVDERFCASDALTLPAAKPRPNGENFSAKDRLADWLRERALKEGRNGEIYFECPWISGHTAKTNVQDTVYFPVGARGGERGGFKCLHAHCAHRTVKDLREWARSQGFTETDASDFPDESGHSDGDGGESEPGPELPGLERFLDAKSGKFQACLEALELALSSPAFCGIEFAFDAFSAGPVFRAKDAKWMPYKDETATKMRLALEAKGFKRIPRQDIIDLIQYIALRQKIDLMRDYLDENIPEWDGIERINTFFQTYCGGKNEEWERAVARYMFSALWARAYCTGGEKGVKADIVPVLVGQQGTGKSTLARLLALDEDKCGNIDFELENADLARAMREKIIMEIPELGGMTKREQNGVKAFISEKTDSWIPKFRETERRAARRCIFIMTTNDREFLSDPTGNRRWAPVEVGKIDFEAVERDRLQLWAEGRALFDAGGVLFQDVERLNVTVTENYMAADSWEILISDYIDRNRAEDYITSRQLFEQALNLDFSKIKRADQMRLSGIMRKIGFEKRQRRIGEVREYVWEVP